MSDRPLGVTLLCGFFAFLGLGTLVSAFSYAGASSKVPAGRPESVHLFLTFMPIFMALLGLLGLYAAAALWVGHSSGTRAGLLWLGCWVVEEVAMAVWTTVGPEVVQRLGGGISDTVVRILVASAMAYYLATVGREYTDDDVTHSSSSRGTRSR